MVYYAAYGILRDKKTGKRLTKVPFRTERSTSSAGAKRKALASTKAWNKWNRTTKDKRIVAEFVKIRKVKQ